MIVCLSYFSDPPEVYQNQALNSSFYVEYGDSLAARITVDGFPMPNATLTYDGEWVADMQHLLTVKRMELFRVEYTVSIINITEAEVGLYTLRISNTEGKYQYQFRIAFTETGMSANRRYVNKPISLSAGLIGSKCFPADLRRCRYL